MHRKTTSLTVLPVCRCLKVTLATKRLFCSCCIHFALQKFDFICQVAYNGKGEILFLFFLAKRGWNFGWLQQNKIFSWLDLPLKKGKYLQHGRFNDILRNLWDQCSPFSKTWNWSVHTRMIFQHLSLIDKRNSLYFSDCKVAKNNQNQDFFYFHFGLNLVKWLRTWKF